MQSPKIENAILIGVRRKGMPLWEVDDNLDELEQLVETAGGAARRRLVQDFAGIDAGTFVSKGKAAQLNSLAGLHDADLVVFDDDLTPGQVRNLERMLSCKIIDRQGLILDIFASRAKSREARIQVELAQLLYLRPRLTKRWQHLSRQEGGIGTRGPGETQLEIDRQALNKRVASLRSELTRIERARTTRRKKRRDLFKAAIIGYTNVGKSTLLNALTGAGVFVEDRLFATLDPTVRLMRLANGRRVLVIDTVGFIRKLPVGLAASFRSTLEESRTADLFVHMVDLSHPHWEGQLARTDDILRELELDHTPQILVFNKVDRVDDAMLLKGLIHQYPEAIFVSALRGIRLHELVSRITEFTGRRWTRGQRAFSPDEAAAMKEFEREVNVVGRSFRDGRIQVDYLVEMPD